MDWQTYAAAGIVTLTLVVFLVRLAKRKPKAGCGHGCACPKKHQGE